ncbi:ABC transporter ATP-binding protein [Thiohalorhabdus sp. Cl-TMA]|uniref:ABC transporter ATP-binding protein n=1 Tax=Thiohalorhabdus methylotrophus TaxID=3242694 RepID=A0ABV4TWZ9_9GAMM
MSQAAISIQGIRKSFGKLQALKGIDLEIQRGEFFGLLGPNGAGKSTLISTIAGLVVPDGGKVEVLGNDTVKNYRHARRNIGVVPQEVVYDPFFTVEEVIRNQAGYFGVRDMGGWLDELLDALELDDKRDANMRQLSGGMKRRVLIAQALAHRPPIAILDEPTAGVDVELRRSLWEFTRRLNGEGMTVVLTTHYLEEAEELCDRIAIIHNGAVQALDTKDALLARDTTRSLCVTLEDAAARIPETLTPFLADRDGEEVHLRFNKEEHSPVELLNRFQEAGVAVKDLHTFSPSLEDIFRSLTGEHLSTEEVS